MDKLARGFSEISTVFDHDRESPHRLFYSSSIRSTLTKLLPSNFFLFDEASGCPMEAFSELLPLVKWVEWGKEGLQLSVYMLCRQRVNGVRFFYDMISKWLIPGKRPSISSFFASDFQLSEFSDELFTVCEIVISFNHLADLELVRHQMPIMESEIRMGLTSVYHASRILEIKGLSADEKTSLIQERIAALQGRRPKDFDYAIFTQMQHFLVVCNEEFKAIREHVHMSRIICTFYLFRKALRSQIERDPSQRFVHVKVSRTFLHHPFGVKKVLGIFAGLNFQGDNELFEQRHFAAVFNVHFPHLSVVEGSFFFRTSKQERVQLLYLEVEKTDGADFTLSEVKEIKDRLPAEIRSGIEKLARPLFMPRNEEEVMRNIITLSNQLKLARDLPQVIINFESQVETELTFTVIWLRVLKFVDVPIQKLFEKGDSFLRFIPDRIKHVGFLRKKSPKEANVFQLKFSAQNFLRPDHSVDLFKARQSIVLELNRLLGEFRDYNGGMIAKQHEQFVVLKQLLSYTESVSEVSPGVRQSPGVEIPASGSYVLNIDPLAGTQPRELSRSPGPTSETLSVYTEKKEELLLENFFHSIFPVEHRSVFNPLFIKDFFLLFLEATQSSEPAIHQASKGPCCYFLLSCTDNLLKERVMDCVKAFQISSSQLLGVSLEHLGISYFGYIYFEEDAEKRNCFLKGCGENLTFELKVGNT